MAASRKVSKPARKPAAKRPPPARARSRAKRAGVAPHRLGGVHPDSAALKDLLALAGVVDARTGKPLSEALCFGIAGGIAAGYAFSPELHASGLSSGIAFVGRHRQFLTDARWQTEFCRRLDIRALALEEPNEDVAEQNLLAALKGGRPVLAWCSPVLFPALSWTATAGMYTLLVHSADSKKQRFAVSDHGPKTFDLSFQEMASIRGRVNLLQNRILLLDPPASLPAEVLAAGAIAGIKACVYGARDLEQRGHRALPLADAAGLPAQHHHSLGWKPLFPEGKLYLALADTWQCIAAASNGGGWFRPLFAEFLDEAAELTGRKALRACADRYRKLGAAWTSFAAAALPKRYAAFAKTQAALAKIEALYRAKGRAADAAVLRLRAELARVEQTAIARFPLDGHGINRLLDDLAARLGALAGEEAAAAAELRRAVQLGAVDVPRSA